MTIRPWMAAAAFSVLAVALPAQQLQPPEARFVPLRPLTTDFEVIFGDPEAAGQPFVMRIRELPGTIIPPHSHPVDEHITVLERRAKGTYWYEARRFDYAALLEVAPSGFITRYPKLWEAESRPRLG